MTCPVTGALCACTIGCAAIHRPIDLNAKRVVDEYAAKQEAFEPRPLGRSVGFNATCINCGEYFNAALQHMCKARVPANPDIEEKTGDVRESGQVYDTTALKMVANFDEDGNPDGADLYIDGRPVRIIKTYQNVGTSEQVPTNGNAPGEGGWYSRFNPQPIEIIEKWNLDHHRASIIQYLVRSDAKGGVEDLKKARWYLDRLIEQEEKRAVS